MPAPGISLPSSSWLAHVAVAPHHEGGPGLPGRYQPAGEAGLVDQAARDLAAAAGQALHRQQLGARMIRGEAGRYLLVVVVAADLVACLAQPGDQRREHRARLAGDRLAP